MSIVSGIPEAEYHSDTTTLSSTGAKRIIDCPARFKWERDNGRVDKKAYDDGHAVHELVLGIGQGIVKVDADSWRTNAAKEQRDEIRANGQTPMLAGEYDEMVRIADAVMDHPIAGPIFSEGDPERSIYWTDEETGVNCRGRLDWLRTNAIVDLKTTTEGGARTETFTRNVISYGYDMQADWYQDGYEQAGGQNLPYLWVVVEKVRPYVVSVFQASAESLARGRERNREARQRYRDCIESGVWPGYTTDIEPIYPPRWAS